MRLFAFQPIYAAPKGHTRPRCLVVAQFVLFNSISSLNARANAISNARYSTNVLFVHSGNEIVVDYAICQQEVMHSQLTGANQYVVGDSQHLFFRAQPLYQALK